MRFIVPEEPLGNLDRFAFEIKQRVLVRQSLPVLRVKLKHSVLPVLHTWEVQGLLIRQLDAHLDAKHTAIVHPFVDSLEADDVDLWQQAKDLRHGAVGDENSPLQPLQPVMFCFHRIWRYIGLN